MHCIANKYKKPYKGVKCKIFYQIIDSKLDPKFLNTLPLLKTINNEQKSNFNDS